MSMSVTPKTFKNGFSQPSEGEPWVYPQPGASDVPKGDHYVTPQSVDVHTSPVNNSLGDSVLRTWPTIFNGTARPDGVPEWWKPSSDVDVLIIGGMFISFSRWYDVQS
jgi:phenol 2-monooxygenase